MGLPLARGPAVRTTRRQLPNGSTSRPLAPLPGHARPGSSTEARAVRSRSHAVPILVAGRGVAPNLPGMPATCVFCGACGPMSAEHVLPQWMRTEFAEVAQHAMRTYLSRRTATGWNAPHTPAGGSGGRRFAGEHPPPGRQRDPIDPRGGLGDARAGEVPLDRRGVRRGRGGQGHHPGARQPERAPLPCSAAVNAYTSPRRPESPAAGRGDHGRGPAAVDPAFTAAVAIP